MRPDLQIDGTEVMWLEIKIEVGIILLSIIYGSPSEASKIISLGDHNVDFFKTTT